MLAKAMYEDGVRLLPELRNNGYVWYVGDYQVHSFSIREVWGITRAQQKRLVEWLIDNNSEVITWE